MKVSDFRFELPEKLIAQSPLPDRAAARMLVVDRAAGRWEDRSFRDLPTYLRAGDRLVINDTRVIPARLYGRLADSTAAAGGRVETLLVKRLGDDPPRWEALARPARKLRPGARILYPEGLEARVVGAGERGLRVLEFSLSAGFSEIVELIGRVPLPPYIRREDDAADRLRYQTVFASKPGSAAAPTAGLHFTPEMPAAVEAAGARVVRITLHVGLGTFQPVRVERVEEHRMHSEAYEISPEAAAALAEATRIVAVGTTSARTLEHAARLGDGRIAAGAGDTDIFIYPGFKFRAVGALLTNFHLPESTLLMLAAAFAGRELTLEAYRHAVREEYRFYSYGDCMLLI